MNAMKSEIYFKCCIGILQMSKANEQDILFNTNGIIHISKFSCIV